MSQLNAKESAGITPAVHLEFIQNQAGLPEAAGIEEVESYHRAVFLHHHARDLERFRQEAKLHEDRILHLESRLQETRAKLGGLEKLVPVDVDGQPDIKPTLPWNLWDRAMFISALLGIATLLVFGILNISFNLLESGLVTFIENPVRAYFWAALLPVGALGVKIGWDFLESQQKRQIYLWACLAFGIAGVLVWVGAYATVYPTLSKTTKDQIESLSVFGENQTHPTMTASGTKWVDVITVAAQATAEIFLSAVLGIYLTMVYSRHRPVRLAANPLFGQLEDDRHLLEENVADERLALAEAKGNLSRLENQLSALISFAKSIFQKEVALKRDQSQQKRLLLDQISEQIRSQLQTVENGDIAPRTHAATSPALGSSYGK